MGLAASPAAIRIRASSGVVGEAAPAPPSVKAGRMTTGAWSAPTKRIPSSTLSTTDDSGTGSPMPITRLGSRRGPPRPAPRRAGAQDADAMTAQHARRRRGPRPG